MDAKKLDLRILVIKHDLEKAIFENYSEKRNLLNDLERKTLEKYSDNDYDALELVRDLLIERDYIEDTMSLLEEVSNQIFVDYPLEVLLHQQVREMYSEFIDSISDNSGNNKNIFLAKHKSLK